MSRVGKLPLEIPSGVEAKMEGRRVQVTGPKGTLIHEIHPLVDLEWEGKSIMVRRRGNAPKVRALHGLTRALLGNMVRGVSTGFEKSLAIVGIGYKAQMSGSKLVLNLGYSSPIEYSVPEGIDIQVENQTNIKIAGVDKQKVGQVAAEVRSLRPVEPYKGKGIRYVGERVRRKEGKAAT